MARVDFIGRGGGSTSGGDSGSSDDTGDQGGGSSGGSAGSGSSGGGSAGSGSSSSRTRDRNRDRGGGGGSSDRSDLDRMRETVERFKREVREQTATPGGMDAGEPIAGVDGAGDPRTAPNDPQVVEGPSPDGSSVDGLGGGGGSGGGGSGGGGSPTDQLRDLQDSPTSGGGRQTAADPMGGGGTSGLDDERPGGGDPTATLRDRQGAPTSGGSPLGDGTARDAGASLDGDGSSDAAVADQELLSGGVGDQARAFEQQVLDETALEDPDQVRIVREGDTLRAEVTDIGREFLGRQQRRTTTGAVRAARDLAAFEAGMRTDEQEAAREQAVTGVRGASEAVEQDPGRTDSALFAALSQDQQMEANEDVIGQISRQQSRQQLQQRDLEGRDDFELQIAVPAGQFGVINTSVDDLAQVGVDALDPFTADETRDFGDTSIENPRTGNRIETDLNDANRRLAAAAEQLATSPLDPTRLPGAATIRLADAVGAEGVAQRIDANQRALDRVQVGGTEALFTAAPSVLIAGKEVAETGGAVVTGEASPTDVGRQAGRLAEQTGRAAVNNPLEFLGGAAVGVATGTAATRATQAGARAAGRARVRAGADAEVDFADITTEQAVTTGELPKFDTSPNAPTSEAVAEVRRRAADVPEPVSDVVGTDRVLFRSESARLDADFEAGGGEFELPGLFASPETSTLRTEFGSGTSGGTRLRLPRLADFRTNRQRLSAFKGDRIEGAPSRAAESGFAVEDSSGQIIGRFGPNEGGAARALEEAVGGRRVPDPDTAGARFLREEAEPGTAFVRPTGDRTSELEAVFPEGSEFSRSGTVAVNLPDGDVGTLDVFRRAEGPRRSPTGRDRGQLGGGGGLDVVLGSRTYGIEDIRRRGRRGDQAPEGEPILPTPFASGVNQSSVGGATGPSGSGSEFFPSGPPTTSGAPSPAASPPTSPPSTPPSEISDPPIGLPPSSPPTTPPTGSPSEPGGSSLPPSSSPPPGSPGAGDPFVPVFDPPSPPRRDEFDIDLDADGQTSGFLATASEQEFINRIGTVSDIIGP